MPAVKPEDVEEEQSDSDPATGEAVEPTAQIGAEGEEWPVSDAVEFTFDQMYSEVNHINGQLSDVEETVARQQDQIEELRDAVEELIVVLEKAGIVENAEFDWGT